MAFYSFATKMTKISYLKSNHHLNTINRQASWSNDTFAHCFRPIYIFSRAFGLMPFSIICQSNGGVRESKVTKFDALWFAHWLCLLLFGIVFALRMANSHHSDPKAFSIISTLGDTGKTF